MNRNGRKVLLIGLASLWSANAYVAASDAIDDKSLDLGQEQGGPRSTAANYRDPTVPSARLLERLKASLPSASSTSVKTEPRNRGVGLATAPDMRLKALVLGDADHASAILSVNGKSISLNLSRDKLRGQFGETAEAAMGFRIGGISYVVEDFSEHSILLRLSSDNSTHVVESRDSH